MDPSPRILNVLLVLAAVGFAGTCVFGWGWYRAARQPVEADRLSTEVRQALVQEMLKRTPGIYRPTWFAPEIGYVLQQGPLTAWNDTFTPNVLGYRTYPPEKPPNTFRIVFVGDSWTYGMGVREEETFARHLEVLANQQQVSPQQIQTWVLGLPSYNTPNQIAALRYFFDQLQPDAVVLCPVMNDVDNTSVILPNGSPTRAVQMPDDFGDGLSLSFRFPNTDSQLQLNRWRMVFQRIKGLEVELKARRTPFLLFFTAFWEENWLHQRAQEAGLETPYVVLPSRLSQRKWRNPPPLGHPTAAAHQLHAKVVYQGLADLLAWPALPEVPPAVQVAVHRAPVPVDTAAMNARLNTHRNMIPPTYAPPAETRHQVIAPLDRDTGLMGQMTAIWIRRQPGKAQIVVTLEPVAEAPSLYPLALTIAIPAATGASSRTVGVQASGRQTFRLPMPEAIPAGEVLDVLFQAERVAYTSGRITPGAVYIKRIIQE